ncbi:MAG: CHRD domain-containing protein, partial [Chloroflexi bacterium]|nr:CHRD domain-containing protein [Chloroflexota bacterium]
MAIPRMIPVFMGAILIAMSMALLTVAPVSADTTFDIEISGAAEVCDVATECGGDGTGTAVIDVVTDTDEICFDLDGADVTLPITAAHIHEAPEGEAGPVVVALFTDPEADFPISGCVTADAGLVAEIEANPENYYVNLHNADFPAGALRGQLAAAQAETVQVSIMKHLCDEVTTVAEFNAVENAG